MLTVLLLTGVLGFLRSWFWFLNLH